MATFPKNIPQTPALASGDLRDDQAPAIADNDQFGDHSARARSESLNRKRLREVDPNTVSEAEVKQSRIRQVAVETAEAQATYQLGNVGILASLQALTQNIEALTQSVQTVAQNQQTLTQKVEVIQASLANFRGRKKNRRGTWTYILVERLGNNPVGQAPANHPQSRESVFTLTGNEITDLQHAFNLPPGHFDGATLVDRQGKVLDYLTDDE